MPEDEVTGGIFTHSEKELLTDLIDQIDNNAPPRPQLNRRQYSEILKNRFFAIPKYSTSEHAQILGIPEGTYKRRSSEALKLLDRALGKIADQELTSAVKVKINSFKHSQAKVYNAVMDVKPCIQR